MKRYAKRILNGKAKNNVYLPLDLPGTFWTQYEAVNEAVIKLILVPESGYDNGNSKAI